MSDHRTLLSGTRLPASFADLSGACWRHAATPGVVRAQEGSSTRRSRDPKPAPKASANDP